MAGERGQSRTDRVAAASRLWPGVRQGVASRVAASLTAKRLEARLAEHGGLTAQDVRDVAAAAVRTADEVLLTMADPEFT